MAGKVGKNGMDSIDFDHLRNANDMSKADVMKLQAKGQSAKIKVIGVGGGGCNAIGRMLQHSITDAEFIAVDTDLEALNLSPVSKKIQIGANLTKGRSAAGDVALGRSAAEEAQDTLLNAILPSNIVLLVAGMGGGVGTGATPMIAELAKKNGTLTVAIVSSPLFFEGARRSTIAGQGILILKQKADVLIRISNDRFIDICDLKVSADSTFRLVDEMMGEVVRTIIEAITVPGIINLEFEDIRAVLRDAGLAVASVGVGVGLNRAVSAAGAAINNSLIDTPIYGATSVFSSISGDNGFSLFEVNEAAKVIAKAADPYANIIFSVHHNPHLQGYVKVVIIASGLQDSHQIEFACLEDEEFYQFVGQHLKQARMEAGRTQEECAKAIGLKSGVGYANYESGKRRVSLSRLKLLANYLGHDLTYFLRVPREDNGKLATRSAVGVGYPTIVKIHGPAVKNQVLPETTREEGVARQGERGHTTMTLTVNWDSLIERVAQHFGIGVQDIFGKSQNRRVCLARQIAMYLMREHSLMSFAAIGEYFAKDPSTVFNAYKKIAAYSILDNRLKQHVSLIREKLRISEGD